SCSAVWHGACQTTQTLHEPCSEHHQDCSRDNQHAHHHRMVNGVSGNQVGNYHGQSGGESGLQQGAYLVKAASTIPEAIKKGTPTKCELCKRCHQHEHYDQYRGRRCE